MFSAQDYENEANDNEREADAARDLARALVGPESRAADLETQLRNLARPDAVDWSGSTRWDEDRIDRVGDISRCREMTGAIRESLLAAEASLRAEASSFRQNADLLRENQAGE